MEADSVKFCVGVPVQIHFQFENNFEDNSDCRFFDDNLWPSSIYEKGERKRKGKTIKVYLF